MTGPCGSGIAHQTSGQHGLELLCRAVEGETEPLATVTLLLRLCRDEHRTLWECAHEPHSLQAVADITDLLTPLPPGAEDFYRADTARDRNHGGSGIGLSIARALVKAHGGTIRATSAGVGRGTTFTVLLPDA